MADRELLVRIIGDDRDMQRALKNTERGVARVDNRTASFGRNIGKAFAAAGVTIALSEGIRLADAYIDAATNLQEQQTRSAQIFDESAASVERWSESLASSFGIAQAKGLEFAGTFGLLFRNLGSNASDAETFSRQIVELAADLASFNNTDVETALNALRSGLTGEIEPLRKFGVFLSEARTQQQALTETGKSTTASLTTQEKVLARLSLIMADTTRAQGDFARTSDGLANKQRIAAAEAQDLATSIGKVLAPAMEIATISTIALVGGLNDLIAGMGGMRAALQDSDMFDGFNVAVEEANAQATGFFQNLRDNIPLLDRVAALRNAVVGGGVSSQTAGQSGGFGGIGKDIARRAKADAKQTAKDAGDATRELARARREFDEFIKGLGLKLDRARLTSSNADDLATLREIERAIQKRIRAEGRTFKLVDQLTQVQLQIASAVGDAQSRAQERETDVIERRFEQQERRDEQRRERLQRQQERRQGNQFEALGLTPGGDQRTPSGGALRRRSVNLEERIKGTVLDTQKNMQILDRIQSVLEGDFRKVGKNVRQAILGMLNDISSAFDEGSSKQGPLTKTAGLNSKKILAGLGLSEEEINALRGRLSSINSSGLQIATGQATGATGRVREGGFGNNPIFVESHTTINLDGQQVAKVVTKQQQKSRRRNPLQKRGPNRNR